MPEIPTKPYLIRALYEWCADNGYRPYIAVAVDERTLVPREFVRNGEIVLNISTAATNRLTIGNELLEFEARFGGVARQVSIPIENVSAIFAQENGHGMAFEVPKAPALPPEGSGEGAGTDAEAAGTEGAGTDAAALPAEAEPSNEGGAPEGAPTPGRVRKRPKLAAVPAADEPSSRPARRKGRIAAVPAPKAPSPRAPAIVEPASGDAADRQGGDDPGPTTPVPGKPHLTRVK